MKQSKTLRKLSGQRVFARMMGCMLAGGVATFIASKANSYEDNGLLISLIFIPFLSPVALWLTNNTMGEARSDMLFCTYWGRKNPDNEGTGIDGIFAELDNEDSDL